MHFEWLRLEFTFTALETVVFPPLLAANVLRGALGLLSRKLACGADCPGAALCPDRQVCLYARVFEPAPPPDAPSGLADLPRPFVFRARHLDGRTIKPGVEFGFVLHLFSQDADLVEHLRQTFASLEEHGLGHTRGRVRLRRMTGGEEVHSIELEPPIEPRSRIWVRFVSPTELKAGGTLSEKPEFPALIGRIRDRVAMLSAAYGAGPLHLDFRGLASRTLAVRMTECDIRPVNILRHSTRTGQTHGLGGFVGKAMYEGDLAEFLPWLKAGEIAGVGRQAVWGKGEIEVSDI